MLPLRKKSLSLSSLSHNSLLESRRTTGSLPERDIHHLDIQNDDVEPSMQQLPSGEPILSQIKLKIIDFEEDSGEGSVEMSESGKQEAEKEESVEAMHEGIAVGETMENLKLEECDFCASAFDEEFFEKAFACSHMFCGDCLMQYFKTKIKEFKLIECPLEECRAELQTETAAFKLLGQDFINKYEDIKFRKQVQSRGEDYRICPDENCPRGVIHAAPTQKKGKCDKCNKVFCMKCHLKEHGGKCEGVQIYLLKDKFRYKRCVKCRMVVERNQGCPHMTCKCGAQFCYNCGGKWGSSHYCIRNRVNDGVLITDKLNDKLKCLRVEEYEYQHDRIGFLTRIPYYIACFFILLMWGLVCLAYGAVYLSLCLVAGVLSGHIYALCSLYKSFNKCAKFLFGLGLILFPLLFPISGLIMAVVLIYQTGGEHLIYPMVGGYSFPVFKVFKVCCG